MDLREELIDKLPGGTHDLLVELATPCFQSLDQLFFRGQRQLVFAREDLIHQVA
jgi:hypothetical protein